MRPALKSYLGMITIAIVAVLVIGAVGVRIDRSQEQNPPAGFAATPAISGNAPEGLVDARWLQQYLPQVDYIIDLSDVRQFEAGHIPGAVHVWWQDAASWHSHNFAFPDQFTQQPAERTVWTKLDLNMPQVSRIVLYDQQNSERATWMRWVMESNGFTDVHVLDGGLGAWVGQGGELTTEVEDPREETVTATPTSDYSRQINGDELQATLDGSDAILIDTRSEDELEDTVNGTIREGHIPGSINILTAEVMREDGTFKSPEELQQLFEAHGIPNDTDQEIVVYSLFSSQSGNVWMALRLAGFDNVVIYDEGYYGWSINPDRPVDTEPYAQSTPITATSVPATPVSTPASTPVASPDVTSTPSRTPDSTPEEDGPTDLTGI